MDLQLTDKIVVVTGAASGIGAATQPVGQGQKGNNDEQASGPRRPA
jgi:hypothetical protein